jgi:hypothetical protein
MLQNLGKNWLTLFLLLWSQQTVVAQRILEDNGDKPISLLSEHRFADGGYSILVVPEANYRFNQADSELVSVYFDQVTVLERISKGLVAYSPAVVYPFGCFDSQQIFVCKNGKPLETLVISENCHSITASEGEFAHTGFFPFQDYKLAKRQFETFADVVKARKMHQERSSQPGLLLLTTPQWLEYDGEFGYYLDDDQSTTMKVEQDAIAEFSKQFPGEIYELSVEAYGHSPAHPWNYRVLVKCRKSLFDSFGNRHEIDWGGWKPYELTLESYWKGN